LYDTDEQFFDYWIGDDDCCGECCEGSSLEQELQELDKDWQEMHSLSKRIEVAKEMMDLMGLKTPTQWIFDNILCIDSDEFTGNKKCCKNEETE
jgi:hypothetical protein